jgi:hypothetical protein
MAIQDQKTLFNNMPSLDSHPDIAPIINLIYKDSMEKLGKTVGDKVSVQTDCWPIMLSGHTKDTPTTNASGFQLMQLPDGVISETLSTSNDINRFYSTVSTGTLRYFGSRIDAGKVSLPQWYEQTITASGELTLTTAVNGVFYAEIVTTNSLSSPVFYIYRSGVTFTTDTPTTNTSYIALQNSSRVSNTGDRPIVASKAAFKVPDGYYVIFKRVSVGMSKADTSAVLTTRLEVKEYAEGGFKRVYQQSSGNNSINQAINYPLVYAGPNSDIRLSVYTNKTTNMITGTLEMYLCKIIE